MQAASNASCHVFNKYVKREIVKIVDEEKVRKSHVFRKAVYVFALLSITCYNRKSNILN